MKKLLSIISLLAFSSFGGEHSFLTIRNAAIATNSSATVTNSIGVGGKVLAIYANAAGGSSTVHVYTVSNIGTSHGASKTILPAIVVGASGFSTNLASPIYLAGDLVVAKFGNSTTTSSVTPVVSVIYEK
jgi:hypothetical protein